MYGSHPESPQLIAAMRAGDRGAGSRLLWLVHDELKAAATARLERTRGEATLNPSGLVRGAYLKLAANTRKDWRDRAHFMAVASEAARRVVRDLSQRAATRGRPPLRIRVPEALGPQQAAIVDAARLETAIARLAPLDGRQAELAVHRLYGGLDARESGGALDADATVMEGQWAFVRAWLNRELARGA